MTWLRFTRWVQNRLCFEYVESLIYNQPIGTLTYHPV